MREGTRTLFVVVPGVLGYSWEWDAPRRLIEATPGAAMQVFSWAMWSSPARVADDLVAQANRLLAGLPRSVDRIFMVGHSAGGVVTALAASRLMVPPGRSLLIANVGTPYAGMHTAPIEQTPDQLWSPFPFAVGGVITRYPEPAPGVLVESWMTSWPGDPVMQPRHGHDPGDPAVGPPGPRHRFPPGVDHNRILEDVVRELLAR